ncbi:MAG: hypothetical protein WD397_05370 [Wenzhouxiangellaceae bacterium]
MKIDFAGIRSRTQCFARMTKPWRAGRVLVVFFEIPATRPK